MTQAQRRMDKTTLQRYYNFAKRKIINSMKKIEYRFKLSFNMVKRQRVTETKWDNLIVLDSCRYDYFKQEYSAFLDGKLTKVISPASCTVEWLKKIWKKYYKLTYVSAIPAINSKGVPRLGYIAADHFSKIIDVWDFGWDTKLGTTPPQDVNQAVLNKTDRQNLVIHYVQPHQPYIGKTKLTFSRTQPTAKGMKLNTAQMIKRQMAKGNLTSSKLQKAYVDNLRLVLKWVAKLVPCLKGKAVITADHGEMLGEDGEVWHPCGSYDPRLKEVPWFEVK